MILLKLGLLLIALKACGVYADEPPDKTWNICENKLVTLDEKCPSVLICYQSKLAKDSGNWKAGNRFRDGTPYESAKTLTGMMPLDSSFGSKSLSNVSNYPEINNDKALASDNQSAGEEFMNALPFGAFMIDFDGMPLQIAALEIRQSIGKNDTKLCKTKCAAKWESQTETSMETEPQTETPMDSSTMKIPKNDSQTEKNPTKNLSATETSTETRLSPVTPKAQHVDHFGTNWKQIEFPMDVPSFSLNVSISPYWIACAAHQRNNKTDHTQDNYTKVSEVATQDQFNACSQVPTSSVCNKSLEFYACYKSIKNQPHMNKEIAEICQKRLSQAPFVAGFRVRICMHRDSKNQTLAFESRLEFSSSVQIIGTSLEFQFKSGEVSKLMRYVPFSFTEFGHQPKEIHEAPAKDTVLDSIANEQINGSWSKIIHFNPPSNEALRIFFKLSNQSFTKLITRKTNLQPWQNNPDITHPSRCDILGDNCEPIRKILEKVEEMHEWCAPYNPTNICISPGWTPTPEDLKPFELPPWDNTTEDPLEAGDVLYTKEQAQGQHDYLAEMCSKCRNSSQSEKVLRRQKRQFLRAATKWIKFPIPIRFDTVSLGEGIIHADTTVRYGAAWISEHTCVDFTFDETNDRDGIEIIYNGDPTICGNSKLGRVGGWQHLSINCGEMYTGAHELLHALGVQHEDQRFDRDRYIKMNPLSKEFLHYTKDDGFPYDYGSIMHYPPNIKNHAYDKISLNRFYQQSMGQTDKPSFRDYAVINHAYCEGKCGPEFWCKNGGYPNPRFCSECECPWGYEGNHCENLQRDLECKYKMEGNRELEADWQTRTLDTLIHCWSEKCVCVWRITPKEGKKLRIQLKRLEIEDSQCSHRPCQKSFIEINFRKDKRARGARFCCPDAIALVSPAQNWIEAEEAGTDIIISTSLAYWHKPVVLVLTYETDGAKIVAAEDCPDPRELFFKERNPGGSVSCHKPEDTNKDIPCSRAAIPFNCDAFNPGYFAWINGYRTNKTVITMECFKREDNPTSYWGYWANKTQDPIHIDDIQCVKYVREPKFKSAEVEDSAKVEDTFKNANGSTVYMGYKKFKQESLENAMADQMDSAPPFRFDEPNFLHYPSKNDFKNVFQYLFQCIEPTFRVQKIEQHALNLLNLYGYPYALNARTMQTITYPTSWGQLLGALDWMIDIVEADIDLTADLTKASPKMIIRTQQHVYVFVNMVFNKLFDGSDEFLYSDLLQPDARRTKSVMAQLIRYYKLKCDMAKHLSLVDNQIDEQVHAYDFEKACERTTNAHDCEEALGRIEGRNEDFMSKDGDLIKSWTLRKSKRIKNIERIQKLLDEAQRENARQMFLAEQKRSISGGKQTKSQARGRKSQIRILDELKHMETEVANMRQKYDQAIQINRKLQRGVGELRVTGQCLESLNSGIRKLEMLQDSMVEMRAKDGEGRKHKGPPRPLAGRRPCHPKTHKRRSMMGLGRRIGGECGDDHHPRAMQMQEELNATSLHYRGRPYHLTDSGEADMDIELTWWRWGSISNHTIAGVTLHCRQVKREMPPSVETGQEQQKSDGATGGRHQNVHGKTLMY
ncbi:hypothetical protein GPALN_007805 [Globodera pallida]|nr:hypothetical protein GPALN_007805 [Globodera pallida]